MNRLEETYKDQIDFIHVNFDNPEAAEVFRTYGVTNRSHYYLLDAEGTILYQWIGPLREDEVATEIDNLLASSP